MKPWQTLSYRGQLQRLSGLARAALGQFGIVPQRLVPLRHGQNTTLKVICAAGDRYVLHLYRPAPHIAGALHSQAQWLAALGRDTALAVPAPVPTTDGSLVTVVEGSGVPEPRYCTLVHWLKGRFLDKGLTPAHLARVGIFTAQLHEHTQHWQPPPDFVRGRVDNLTAAARLHLPFTPGDSCGAAMPAHPAENEVSETVRLVTELRSAEEAKFVVDALDRVRHVLAEIGYAPNVFGLIHADLHQENYCFHHGEMRLIDFDDCGYGHHLFDLGVTLIEIQHLPRYEALRAALLAGYRQVRQLPEEHEAYLPTFFALRRIQLLTWVLESREHPDFQDEWVDWSGDLLQGLREFLRS